MTCAFVQTAAPCPACQTVSLEPATASASNDPPVLPEAPGPLLPGASVTVPAGTAGSARHPPRGPPRGPPLCPPLGPPRGPPIVSARPPASSTHALPPAPNPTARTPATPLSTPEVLQPDPVDHAAISWVPASSSATFPSAVRPSPSTCTGRRAQLPGSAGPAARQIPPLSAKTPATPGRAQLPAVTGFLSGPNETAFKSSRPQTRPGALAARASRVVSADHCPAAAAAAAGAAWMVPSLSSASTWPDGETLIPSGTSARAASSR